jgi:hypothetical protein
LFNPETEKDYNDTVQNWAVAYLEMANKISDSIKKDPTVVSHMNEPSYKVH